MSVYSDIVLSVNLLIQSKKLNQSDVADGIGIVRGTLYNYLNNKTPMPLEVYIKICDFFKINPISLFPNGGDRTEITEREIDEVFELMKSVVKERI